MLNFLHRFARNQFVFRRPVNKICSSQLSQSDNIPLETRVMLSAVMMETTATDDAAEAEVPSAEETHVLQDESTSPESTENVTDGETSDSGAGDLETGAEDAQAVAEDASSENDMPPAPAEDESVDPELSAEYQQEEALDQSAEAAVADTGSVAQEKDTESPDGDLVSDQAISADETADPSSAMTADGTAADSVATDDGLSGDEYEVTTAILPASSADEEVLVADSAVAAEQAPLDGDFTIPESLPAVEETIAEGELTDLAKQSSVEFAPGAEPGSAGAAQKATEALDPGAVDTLALVADDAAAANGGIGDLDVAEESLVAARAVAAAPSEYDWENYGMEDHDGTLPETYQEAEESLRSYYQSRVDALPQISADRIEENPMTEANYLKGMQISISEANQGLDRQLEDLQREYGVYDSIQELPTHQVGGAIVGESGFERAQIFIKDQFYGAQLANQSGSDFAVEYRGDLDPEDVRVVFNNDHYEPELDYNLVVENLRIDDQTWDTNSAEVYASGVWKDGAIVDGFGLGDTLHTDGYFQVGSSGVDPGGPTDPGAPGWDEYDVTDTDGNLPSSFEVAEQRLRSHFQGRVDDLPQIDAERIAESPMNELFYLKGMQISISEANSGLNTKIEDLQREYGVYESMQELPTHQVGGAIVGEAGFERAQIFVKDQFYGSQLATGNPSDYAVEYRGDLNPEDVRVVFNNDHYEPELDYNLVVQNIRIDDQTWDTTSQQVYGTGVWSDDALIDGYGLGETLHSDGYFQVLRPDVDPGDGNEPGEESGSFSLASSNVVVSEEDGVAELVINRIGGSAGSASIQYQSLSGTAVAGEDFVPQSGTVTFDDGITSRVISVPILSDESVEDDETFSFAIDSPTGAGLLAPRTATITITDDDNASTSNTLTAGQQLLPGSQPLTSSNSEFRLNLQQDGNLVVYNQENAPVFASNTDGQPVTNAIMQTDGNFVIYHESQPVWDTGTHGNPESRLVLQDSGLLQVIGVSNQTLWSSDDSVEPPVPGELVTEIVADGFTKPTAIDFSADGANMYIAEQRGVVAVQRNGVDAGIAIDLTDRVNGTRDRGLLDIAIHPDLQSNPYLYTLYTYDPPEVNNHADTLAGADKNGNRAGRLTRWTLDAATDYTNVVAGSEEVLIGKNSTWENFNAFANSTTDFDEAPAGILADGSNLQDFIASDSESHTVGSVEFAPDGNLIVSIGDGASYNRVDPRAVRVLDVDNLSGKILRVDAVTGEGVADNPFFDGNANSNRSKVYQMGLRNPFRTTVDQDTGQVYVGDVGWTAWEEINTGEAGANFGWPYYEGGDNGNLQTNGYKDLPGASEYYAQHSGNVTAATAALNHSRDGINAIVLGDVYRGDALPAEYQGDLFFNDLGQGIVRHADLDESGNVVGYETFTTGAQYVVQIVQGPDGGLYFVNLVSGTVGRWMFA